MSALPEVARNPTLQPQTDAVVAFMRARKLASIPQLCEMIYGRNHKGAVRGAGAIYPIAHGERRPGPLIAEMIKDRIGLDLTPFATDKVTRPVGRAAAALVAYESRHGPVVGSPRPPPEQPAPRPRLLPPPGGEQPRLALSIGNDGRGSLAFHLVDAPAAEILRAFSVLQAAGLAIDPPEARGEAA